MAATSNWFANLWPLSAIVITACVHSTLAVELFAECVGKANGFVASRSHCHQYIYCDGSNSFQGECLDDNYFNAATESCDDREAVNCKADGSATELINDWHGVLDPNGNTKNNSASNTHEHIKVNITTTTLQTVVYRPDNLTNAVANNSNSNSNNNNVSWNGSLPPANNILTTAEPPTMLGPLVSLQQVNVLTPRCPQVYSSYNLVHLPNAQSCSMYFTCFNGLAIPMICGRFMEFNSVTRRCERQDQVNCTIQQAIRLECRRGIYDYIPHPRNCQYYYFCSNGFLMIFQCPYNFTWHYERRSCVHRRQAKCFSETILKTMIGDTLKRLEV